MLFIVTLSLIFTYLCYEKFHFYAEMPTNIIGIAVVFPVVFSINAAYKRREQALGYLASLKGHFMALYYAHRDWVPKGQGAEKELQRLAMDTFREMAGYLSKNDQQELHRLYHQLSKISRLHEKLRHRGMSVGEVSRANQYLRSIIVDFEKILNIYEYRTPIALRAYSKVFLNTFPIIFGPFFAWVAQEYYEGAGYIVAALYSVILVSLDNIQDDLEDSFDQIGEDDIVISMPEESFVTL
jgi:hypothetical protein